MHLFLPPCFFATQPMSESLLLVGAAVSPNYQDKFDNLIKIQNSIGVSKIQ
jgi:hypothetical protein